MPTVLGSVRVERASEARLRDEEGSNYGDCSWSGRRIRVHEELRGWPAWQVLYHEWTHIVLIDAGLGQGLPKQTEEVICDAMANALVMLRRHRPG